MLIDITLRITPQMLEKAQRDEQKVLAGHIGTHFDVMDKVFPLEFTRRPGIVFDVSGVEGRDILSSDVALSRVSQNMFAAFYTGFIEKVGYGESMYFKDHPQLSDELIDRLMDQGVSIIGIDFAGVRRGGEHTVKDQYCADRGVFIIENLCNLAALLAQGDGRFEAHTYPMNYAEKTGLPCRVIAEV